MDKILTKKVDEALSGPYKRIQKIIDNKGQCFWLKTTERMLGFKWRFQKGNTQRAFNKEKEAYKTMKKIGILVPEIICEGNDFFLTLDVGPTLDNILRDNDFNQSERKECFRSAGEYLARLHKKGFVHGRPALRDICWQNNQIRFIDLERMKSSKSSKSYAIDLLIFVHYWFKVKGEVGNDILEAINAYKHNIDTEVWDIFIRYIQKIKKLYFILATIRKIVNATGSPARDLDALCKLYIGLKDLR
tara:strand:+ start:14676 stop:15413 length:738 start_codon:yes stop_codon:yes gene_type:complete